MDAFVAAFASGGRLVMSGTWDVKRKDVGAVAVYGGRKDVINVVTAVSERATAKQGGAIGSQVQFEITGESDGMTVCDM